MMTNIATYSYKSFSINATFIEKWLAEMNTSQRFSSKDPNVAKKLLDLFGIKSALDVIIFLNSPEGKIVQSELNKILEQFLINKEISQFIIIQMLAQQRALAFLILGLMHDEEKAQEHLQHILAEEQQYQHLHPQTPQATTTKIDVNAFANLTNTISVALGFYKESQKSIETQLKTDMEEAISLENDWLIYEGLATFISHEKLFFNALLQDIYRLELNTLRMDEKHQDIYKSHELEIKKLHQFCQMPEIDIDTTQLITCLQRIEGYQLQLAALNDFKQVQAQLKPEQTLLLKNGKYFLLSKGTSFEQLTTEQQEAAHQAFLKLTPKLELLEKSRKVDQLSLAEKRQKLLDRSQVLQHRLTQLNVQHIAVLQTIDTTNQLLNQIRTRQTQQTQQGTAPALTLKPTPQKIKEVLTTTSPRPTPQPPVTQTTSSCNQYVAKLELYQLRNNPPPIQTLAANTAYATHLKQLELSTNQQVKPGVPMPPSLQQALARYPNAAILYQQTLKLSPHEPQPTAPRPSPFKNYNRYEG